MGIVKSLESFSSGLHSVITPTEGGGWFSNFVVGSFGEAVNSAVDVPLNGGFTFAVSFKMPAVSQFGAYAPAGATGADLLNDMCGFIFGTYPFFVVGAYLAEGSTEPTLLVTTYPMTSDDAPDESKEETFRLGASSGSVLTVVVSVGSGDCRVWVNGSLVVDRSDAGFDGSFLSSFSAAYLMYGGMQLVPYDYTLLGFAYYGRLVTASEIGSIFRLSDSIIYRPVLSTVSSVALPVPGSGESSVADMGYFPMSYETSYSEVAPAFEGGGLWYLMPPQPQVSYSSRDGSYYVWRYDPQSEAPISGLTFYSRRDRGDSTLEVECASGAVGSVDVRIGSLSSQVSPCTLSVVAEETVYELEYELKDGSGGDTIFMRPSSEATLDDYVSTYIVGRGSVTGAEVSREAVPVKLLWIFADGFDKVPSNPAIDRAWCHASLEGSFTEAQDGHYVVFTGGDLSSLEAIGDYAALVGSVGCFVGITALSSLPYALGCAELGVLYNGSLVLCKRPLYVQRGWRKETKIVLERTDGGSSWVIPASPTAEFAKFKFMLTVAESTVAGSDLSLSSESLTAAVRPTITYEALNPSNPVVETWKFYHPSSDLFLYVMSVTGNGTTPSNGGFASMQYESAGALAEGQKHVTGSMLLRMPANTSTATVEVSPGSYSGTVPIDGGTLTPSAPTVTRTLTWSSGSTSTESAAYSVTYSASQFVGPSGFSVDSSTGKVTVPSCRTFLMPSGGTSVAVVKVSVTVDGESAARDFYINARYTANSSISVKVNADVAAADAVCPWTFGVVPKSQLPDGAVVSAVWNPNFKVDVTFGTSKDVVSLLISEWENSSSVYGIRAIMNFSWYSQSTRLLQGSADVTVGVSAPNYTAIAVEGIKATVSGTFGTGLFWKYVCGCGWNLYFRDQSETSRATLSGEADESRDTSLASANAAMLFVNGLQ